MSEEWWAPGQINFRKEQIIFLLRHLETLKLGRWPDDPRHFEVIQGKPQFGHASYEVPCVIAAETELRLEATGKDGDLCLACFHGGRDEVQLAKDLGCLIGDIERRIDNALTYMSGWERRKTPYRIYIAMRRLRRR